MDLAEIKIYRMTHIANIPHILQHGITHSNSPNYNPKFIPIGDISLINTRNNKTVTVDNNNNFDSSKTTITLGDYIPFYFGLKMPMLYVIQNSGNFIVSSTSPEKIIYLACNVSQIITGQKKFFFSDGHATDNLTTFYDKSKINDLPQIIDWSAVNASYWGGQENLIVKWKKQAEFLVSEDIAPDSVVEFVCYNNATKNELIALGVIENRIIVKSNAYY